MPGEHVIKVGTDICSVKRIAAAYARFGERFLERVLTPSERSYVTSHSAHLVYRLAGRFAAKEAASKALGTGWRGIFWKEIEVSREPSGAPRLLLHGRAAAVAGKLGLKHWEVSLSHDGDYATAFVLGHG